MARKPASIILVFAVIALIYAPSASAESLPLEGRIIILDAGHSVSTTNRYAGYDEQVTMLSLALKIKPLLEASGATVYLTRSDEANVPLPVRAAIINIIALDELQKARQREQNDGYDVSEEIAEIDRLREIMKDIINDPEVYGTIYMNSPFDPERQIHPELIKLFEIQNDYEISSRFLVISLHSNATAWPINTGVNGASAYYISNEHHNTSTYYMGHNCGEQSREFGEILLDLIESAGIRNRGVRFANYFMIREHNVPGVLVENGFHTNTRDRENLQNDSFLDGLALAYLEAVTAYFSGIPLPVYWPRPVYSDVRYGAWYYDAVKYVTQRGLFEGTGSGMFLPDAPMTRAMLVVLLAKTVDADLSGYTYSPYTDVPIGSWYGKAAAWAALNGVTGYISGQSFNPERNATREEMALMIYNYLLMSGKEPSGESTSLFRDDNIISRWARAAVYNLKGSGIIQGDERGRFNPQSPITRAETAQLFMNIN